MKKILILLCALTFSGKLALAAQTLTPVTLKGADVPGGLTPSPARWDLTLPNGERFDLWEDTTQYRRTLHVAQNHPQASDTNDGTADRPFRTIQKAAEIAGAGDLVLIHAGEYHETIRPHGSGKSASQMLCFKGAEGEKVVITGAEVFKGSYKKSEGWKPYRGKVKDKDYIVHADGVDAAGVPAATEPTKAAKAWTPTLATDKDNAFIRNKARVFMTRLPREAFVGTNPFSMVNGPLVPWVGEGPSFIYSWAKELPQQQIALMRRGMVFCDGARLRQVALYVEMADQAGTFFIEDDGLTLHLRLPGDEDPSRHLIEYTAREQCFCPEEPYTSFVRIENLTFIKAGNGFSPPQRGAVSTNCGNHFIINRCVVEDANGVGIDIGFQCPTRYSMAPRGHQVVANCVISRCGMAGICGTTGCSDVDYYDMQQRSNILVNNKLYDNCWQNFARLCESAGIKMHHIRDSLIVGNVVTQNQYGDAIWTDAANENMAIRENVLVRNAASGIYVEVSHHPNEVSHNLIITSGGNGIRTSGSDHIRCVGNVILGCGGNGILHRYGDLRVFLGRGFTGEGMETLANIIGDCKNALLQHTGNDRVDRNVYGKFTDAKPFKVGKPAASLALNDWREKMGWDKNGQQANIDYALETDALKLSVKIGEKNIECRLDFNLPLRPQIEKLQQLIAGAKPTREM